MSCIEETNPIIFDIDTLMRRVFGDKELFNELISIFLRDMPNSIASLKAAYEKENLSEIQYIAHTIKGSAGSFTAESLRKTVFSLEETCKTGDLKKVLLLINTVEMDFEILKKELLKLKNNK